MSANHERDVIERHYGGADLAERLLGVMRAHGVDPGRDGVEAAPPLDHLHSRGRPATEELVTVAEPRPGERVLDAGSGLGGPARLLAARFGCRVLGVDLTRTLCRAARALSAAFGLGDRTAFVQGNVTRLPVGDAAFPLVWTQHAQMNVRDKEAFYAELARALAPGGRLVFHDIFAGRGGAPTYPLPWAEKAEESWLAPPEHAADILAGLGLRRTRWWDLTAESARWAREFLARSEGGPASLLMGETAPSKFGGLAEGLENDRLRVVVARWERD